MFSSFSTYTLNYSVKTYDQISLNRCFNIVAINAYIISINSNKYHIFSIIKAGGFKGFSNNGLISAKNY